VALLGSVSIRNVQKSYGATRIINDVSIDVADGEFLALVGPSGCGKSTLLRMTAGLEDITGGEIWIGPRAVNDLPPKARDVAMVFQNYALYPHMTVAENMGFSLTLRKREKGEIKASVARAAEILGLSPLLSRYPRQLSGGQRQRVAMGRAIVRNPQVFLFDEPLSNLDAKLRVAMRTEVKTLHQRLANTMIYVTHDQIEAMTMADRIVVMNEGRVEQIGSPLELYDQPKNLFVATFIGSPTMNILEGAIDDGTFISMQGLRLPIPNAAARLSDGPLVYGLRPEYLEASDDGIPTEVQVVEPTGSETMIVVKAGGETLCLVQRQRVSARPGELLRLKINPECVHLFDGRTHQRL
jgi:multiple sugar transport system ATP-binding protein